MNNMQGKFPSTRLRRNRMKEFSRRLVAENTLSVNDLILPLFVCEGNKVDDPINSMPGVSRYSIDKLLSEVEKAVKFNIPAIAIFPQIESDLKNSEGSLAVDENNLVCRSIKSIKKDFPNIRKAASKTFMTVGVPFIENPSKREATKKAFEIIEAGADSLMCQNWNLEWMSHLSKFRIPFQSHVGFIPRRTTWIGGIRSFGKTANEAAELFRDIKDIEKTGAWGIEVELVPENILEVITKHTSLVTISIGSGIAADAQFLFAEDILGQSKITFPRHAKKYKKQINNNVNNSVSKQCIL